MPLDGADPFLAPIEDGEEGCLYLEDDMRPCGSPRRARSSYCRQHHALCHITPGSRAERFRIGEIEYVGEFIGRRIDITFADGPPRWFMRALEERLKKRRFSRD